MAGAKTREEARVLTERPDPWSAFEGWWIVGAMTPPLYCAGCGGETRIAVNRYAYIGVHPGAVLCATHGPPEEKKEEVNLKGLTDVAIDVASRQVVAQERLAAAAEKFANAFDGMAAAVTRYVKHLTRQQ